MVMLMSYLHLSEEDIEEQVNTYIGYIREPQADIPPQYDYPDDGCRMCCCVIL